jgi:hypothetical protein
LKLTEGKEYLFIIPLKTIRSILPPEYYPYKIEQRQR